MNDNGVVMGRWQIARLHAGHIELLSAVSERCRQLVVLVGVSPAQPNLRNPLPFVCRQAAILDEFPKAIVLPMENKPTDAEWSDGIDALLRPLGGDIVLYGGRDNSLARYSGHWPTETLNVNREHAGEVDRAAEYIRRDPAFRSGVVWAAKQRFPSAYPAVDIIATQGTHILVGKKPGETLLRFPGGFVDPSDASYEDAAMRELHEECGANLECGPMVYVGSARIDDWRYRDSTDKIVSAIYTTRVRWGAVKAGDDLSVAIWVTLETLQREINPIHKPILDRYVKFLNPAQETTDVQHA